MRGEAGRKARGWVVGDPLPTHFQIHLYYAAAAYSDRAWGLRRRMVAHLGRGFGRFSGVGSGG